jgi:branched-chain amino acid transport system substrate-binding protein
VVDVRAALVTPLSGPLAVYGQASAAALQLWADRFAGPDEVELRLVDAHPDVAGAVRWAEQLHPDLLFGPYGSGQAARAADATTRLLWNHGGARLRPRPNVISVLAPAESYFTGAVEVVRRADPDLRRVAVLHADTGFARSVGEGAMWAADERGLDVERVLLPESAPPADLLLVAGRFEDELSAARALPRGQWPAIGLVAAGVREVLADLDDLEGMLGPAQWLPQAAPEPDLGPSAGEFVASYRARTGEEPPYPAAQAFAAGLIAAHCLRTAGSARDQDVRAAALALDRTTLFGPFRVDGRGAQIGHEVLTVQWQDGTRKVVWPPRSTQAPVRHPALGSSPSNHG